MKLIENISENEMIATFLRAEINSSRFKQGIFSALIKYNLERSIIDNPDFESQKENRERKRLLKKFRGYNNKLLFTNFPTDITWSKVALDRQDLAKVKYTNYSYWVALSNNSRSVAVGAKNVLDGIKIFNQSDQHFWEIVDEVKRGGKLPDVILVAKDKKSDLIILEGHSRLTAYFMLEEKGPTKLEAILGLSKNIIKWDLY